MRKDNFTGIYNFLRTTHKKCLDVIDLTTTHHGILNFPGFVVKCLGGNCKKLKYSVNVQRDILSSKK